MLIAIHSNILHSWGCRKDRPIYRKCRSDSVAETEMTLSVFKECRGSLSEKPAVSGLPRGCHHTIHQGMHHRRDHLCSSLIKSPISVPSFEQETHVPCLISCVSHIGHAALCALPTSHVGILCARHGLSVVLQGPDGLEIYDGLGFLPL